MPTEPITAPSAHAPLFRSFWMGGYEGADHVNSRGEQMAMNLCNGHWQRLEEDYASLARMGIRTIRESVGWRAFMAEGAEAGKRRLVRTAQAAGRFGLQVIWTLHHYGVPDGVDLFAADFPSRFAGFCDVVVRSLRDTVDSAEGPLVFQPINEISFLSWAASSTSLIHPFQPDSPARGFALKCNLVRAALQGTDALWATCPDARIVHTDPLVHVVPAADRPDWAAEAQALDAEQYQAWDMLFGRLEPGLGGAPRYLGRLARQSGDGHRGRHRRDLQHPHLEDPAAVHRLRGRGRPAVHHRRSHGAHAHRIRGGGGRFHVCVRASCAAAAAGVCRAGIAGGR